MKVLGGGQMREAGGKRKRRRRKKKKRLGRRFDDVFASGVYGPLNGFRRSKRSLNLFN